MHALGIDEGRLTSPPLGVVRVVDDAEVDLAIDDEKTEKDEETHRECVEV